MTPIQRYSEGHEEFLSEEEIKAVIRRLADERRKQQAIERSGRGGFEEGITVADVARALSIPVEEVRRLLRLEKTRQARKRNSLRWLTYLFRLPGKSSRLGKKEKRHLSRFQWDACPWIYDPGFLNLLRVADSLLEEAGARPQEVIPEVEERIREAIEMLGKSPEECLWHIEAILSNFAPLLTLETSSRFLPWRRRQEAAVHSFLKRRCRKGLVAWYARIVFRFRLAASLWGHLKGSGTATPEDLSHYQQRLARTWSEVVRQLAEKHWNHEDASWRAKAFWGEKVDLSFIPLASSDHLVDR